MSDRKSIYQPREYLNFNLKAYTEDPGEIKWYKLDTHRWVKKVDGMVYLDYPRVAASTADMVAHFLEINFIAVSDIHGPDSNIKIVIDALRMRKTLRPICCPGVSDIEKVPLSAIHSLATFSLSRLYVKGRVTNVVDGDTVDIAVMIPLSTMTVPHKERKQTGVCDSQMCITNCDGSDVNIIIKPRVRLFGIDTAEKDTKVGQSVKQFAIDKFESLNNIVYIYLIGTDVRGRSLGILYEDRDGHKSINDQILHFIDPQLGRGAMAYYGGTKSDTFRKETVEGGGCGGCSGCGSGSAERSEGGSSIDCIVKDDRSVSSSPTPRAKLVIIPKIPDVPVVDHKRTISPTPFPTPTMSPIITQTHAFEMTDDIQLSQHQDPTPIRSPDHSPKRSMERPKDKKTGKRPGQACIIC